MKKAVKQERILLSQPFLHQSVSEKPFPQSASPTLRYILPLFGCRRPATPPSFGQNLPQTGTRSLRKAFFRHALAFNRSGYNTFDNISLAEQVEDDNRHNCKNQSSHHCSHIYRAVSTFQILNCHRHCLIFSLIQYK